MHEIELTEQAAQRIQEIIAEEDPGNRLRVFVQGGGCSGFSYGFTLDDASAEDDFVITQHGVEMLIDSMSINYLQGARIDYKEDPFGGQFSIENPNAASTCGCGSSFSI